MEVVPYIAAQLLGAIIGALLVNAIFGSRASDRAGPLVGGAIAAVAYYVIAQPWRAADAAAEDRVEGTAGAVEGRRVLPEQ